jgi:ATP-dependent Clp protease ATP-binding subunit ClpC
MRVVSGDVPAFLLEKRVVSLDVGLLMAGAKERGELESRVTGLIAEIKDKKDVILMIDEVHTLVGAGAGRARAAAAGWTSPTCSSLR